MGIIKKLKFKFFITSSAVFLFVVILLVAILNIANYVQSENKINEMLKLLEENGGALPEFEPPRNETHPTDREDKLQKNTFSGDMNLNPETRFRTRFFSVDIGSDGKAVFSDTKNIAAVSESEAVFLAEEIYSEGKISGRSGIYRYNVTDTNGVKKIIFLDCGVEYEQRNKMLATSSLAGLAVSVVIFALFALFSGKAVKPYKENFEKQKRFITDASHELKTPIAIIAANAEVMEMTGGESEWTRSIKNQTTRMTKLVDRLLVLAKAEEELSLNFSDFEISTAVYDTACAFEAVALSEGKKFEITVEPQLKYRGDEGAVRQLVSVLCDNAVKYSDDGKTITVSLKSRGKNIILEIKNSFSGATNKDISIMFDRFYREDGSRLRNTGGNGVGLSVAATIADAHKAKITAKNLGGKYVVITVVF